MSRVRSSVSVLYFVARSPADPLTIVLRSLTPHSGGNRPWLARRSTSSLVGAAFLVLLIALGAAQGVFERHRRPRRRRSAVQAPMFQVDPFWPKPLPNHWLLGSSVGVTVDGRDHVFIVHRERPAQPGDRDRRRHHSADG